MYFNVTSGIQFLPYGLSGSWRQNVKEHLILVLGKPIVGQLRPWKDISEVPCQLASKHNSGRAPDIFAIHSVLDVPWLMRENQTSPNIASVLHQELLVPFLVEEVG